jgi:hypothetical protein
MPCSYDSDEEERHARKIHESRIAEMAKTAGTVQYSTYGGEGVYGAQPTPLPKCLSMLINSSRRTTPSLMVFM